MIADPFAAMGAAAGKACAKPAVEYTIVPLAKSDEPTSIETFADRGLGNPSRCWGYRNEAGMLVSVVARYETETGKQTRPWIHARKGSLAKPAWYQKAHPEPRPIYALPSLVARPDAPVMVVEGEKAADRAAKRFPDHVATTSPNGAQSAGKADWSKMAGRDAVIWPDHDEPGRDYAAMVAKLAWAAGATSVRMVAVPEKFPEGWDLGDDLPDNAAEETLRELVASAPPVSRDVGNGTWEAETDAAAIARLAALSEMEYARARVAQAKRLGVSVGVLDRQVNAARKASSGASAGAATAKRHAPWPEPVALADVLDGLAAALGKHMILPNGAAEAIALWIAHTWVYNLFERTPRLAITSATKRCGKSTLMEILQATSRGAIRADSLTASSVFRVVAALSPLTLVIDEADTFMGENEGLRGVLNSGFAYDGQVLRTVEVEGRHEVQAFSTFAPVALAAIKRIPDTVADRAIPIRLARKSKAETITLLRTEGSRPALADLARQLARWASDDGERLDLNPIVPAAMGDREGDISIALLAIADQAGPGWAVRGRAAMLGLFGLRAADDSGEEIGIMLLTDIRQIFVGKSAMQRSSKDLCVDLATYDERPWPEWRQGRPMTENQLARALRPFGIRPAVIREGAATPRGYLREAFEDAWARYLPDTDPTPKPNPTPDPKPDPAEDEIVI